MTADNGEGLCWLVQGTEGYGLGQAILTLAGSMAEAGARVRVLAMTHGPLAERVAAAGLELEVLDVGRAPIMGGSWRDRVAGVRASRRHAAQALAAARQRLGDQRPRVVHCTSPALVEVTGRLARQVGGLGVWEMPNVLGDFSRLGLGTAYFQFITARYRMLVLANSAYTARSFGTRPRRAQVFHLGVDARRFDPETVKAVGREALGIPDHAAVFSIAARLDRVKGQVHFWKAMLQAGDAARDTHLLVLGGPDDGPVAQELHALATEHNAADRLHLLGVVQDPERYYGLTDVAVNANLQAEPFGLSVIEAMLMARPVLAHAAGGPGETVVDGRTGWHTHDPTVDGWTAALRRVLDDRPRWPTLGQQARQHARAHFTAERQRQRYLDLLHDAGVRLKLPAVNP